MSEAVPPLSTSGRNVILVVAFLGWFFCGFHMQITQLAGRPAAIDLLEATDQLDAKRFNELNKQAKSKSIPSEAEQTQFKDWEALVGRWAAWFQCAFLFGAAAGGLCFGRLGDWIGRSKAMALSIVTYTGLAAVASLAQSPEQFFILWFLACTGVGGMWPNGVALLSEAWSNLSRPMVAGVIGTAANIGILVFATLATYVAIKPDDWRWAPLAGSSPLLLGVIAWFIVPESPRWLATRVAAPVETPISQSKSPSLLGITLIAIVLATVPIVGGWGVSNWMNPWADQAGAALDPPDPFLKARLGQARAFTGIVGSLLGGWIATIVGRRLTYFLVSVLSLGIAQYMFLMLTPTHPWFLTWVSILGFVSGIYFGWLPLCLPELFPTHYRATGAGIGFNFGRIVTAVMLFVSGALMALFDSDYARIGWVTSLFFVFGMVFIWFVPDRQNELG